MTLKSHRLFFAAALLLSTAAPLQAQPFRTPPTFDRWSVNCGNSGMCYGSVFVRDQATWVDIRIIRDWRADAAPLVRLTTNSVLTAEGTISLSVDGNEVDAFPVAQLREIQSTIVAPPGFRPVGGEGFWIPVGPATEALVGAMLTGDVLTVELPTETNPTIIKVPLQGTRSALKWIDQRQLRSGTVSALVTPGDEPAQDAPHAVPVLSPETLPPSVLSVWDANRFCSDIDPAIFASLDAVAAPLEDKSTLYLLPCGAPTAYNTPYVAIFATADGKARQMYVARMTEDGPIASDLIYNAKWFPVQKQVHGFFKGSGLGECGIWDRWVWTGSNFVLTEEASRQTCDGTDVPLSGWTTTWPAVASKD
ncbi:uncharacterized protein DUF1176 [Roseibium hamelinense]|uniref:Uncharacterized protein DUF1176 n=1 Tax=Roseibium hamelinense TaxID=150831 RepID=A0A562SXU3_9HYPH|nr:DUF1176 domain-containing protein [Roseibium hamelinense]MTI43662.1 DUF1176 domain-containing protein [Roseibium hamelinense]TWI86179.1 uncharacterized protein DUF1176 [Roseibium hamelinense]